MTFRSTRSILRFLLSSFLVVALTLAMAEIACRWLGPVILGEPYSAAHLAALRTQRLDVLAERLDQKSESEAEKRTGRRWHPYAGYTFWGDETRQAKLLAGQKRRPAVLRLVILGGSVARGFSGRGGNKALAEALQRKGVKRKLEIWNLARPGYRQPQQLFSLQTWLLLGLEADIIVNLDGFNEVALAAGLAGENANPLYPYRDALAELSKRYRSQSLDPETVEALYHYHRRAKRERAWLTWLQDNPLAHSALIGTTAEVFRRRAEHGDAEAQVALAETAAEDIPYDFRGVKVDFGKAPYGRLARVWRETSELLAETAKYFGASYVHVLQPNQYAAPGKPLSEEEYRTAWRPYGGWAQHAQLGYQFLKMEAVKLKAAGVAFHDLTDLFARERSTVYTDDCCHINAFGNRLLAERLAKILVSAGMVTPGASRPAAGLREMGTRPGP